MTEPSNRMFSFKCSSAGRASVTCLRCGALVAEGRWPRDVYPQAEAHDCAESRS